MKQHTLNRTVSLKGKGLHTGQEVHLTLKPAPVDTGIVFQRMDLYGHPTVAPSIGMVADLVRGTTIQDGAVTLHTIEHLLSALNALCVDNVVVEMDASEPPILDGSAKYFANLILEGEPVAQDKDRAVFELKEPISVTSGNRSLIALPYNGLKITCTSADDRGIHTQHLSLDITPESFLSDIAPARTFTIYEDIEPLIKMGKIKGGSLDSAIVIKGNQVLSKEPLRFTDEFVRHKILDILGDISLLRMPIKAHIIAVRPGHALNAEFTKALKTQHDKQFGKKADDIPPILPNEKSIDIQRILSFLPHRYPFIMIDRIVDIPNDNELRAIKNVTINEPYFQGHFPGNPVMPGVLQIEAMAQAAGILMLKRTSSHNKITLFMSCDKVKFRQAVRPGDQLDIHVKLTKIRANKIANAEAVCRVGDKEVSSAELMFTILDM
ncbi:MAG: UDP-3-O-[3-hydroxymyristoyl] N-acetylglucosamine deacetylase [Verrucomicrobia bacterium GWF2_51_19]|nr:MAG: UDP-3-O-[3-hydroxymyristoyl] N-acetylglucosamine deacetylase [Verrucomicrobia bacterium GWF2_51_19]HCJ11774.1 3-hydroxyacyl-[acyl-carrier-protein] dehydratase FabZ [Opitutae bacterium]